MPVSKKIENLKKAIPEKVKTYQTLRGMRDILPVQQKYWNLLRKKAMKFAKDYGFARLDTPILETTNLFVRGVGKTTDIVSKEMFSFSDQGNTNVSLRPESTTSTMRAYIQHGLFNLSQPVKVYNIGPMFRHENPQSGRLRQFHQISFEALGDQSSVLDAQLILIAYNFLKELGLATNLQINSIGCQVCRPEYRQALVEYLRSKRKELCADCQRRYLKNPLRVLDCKEENCGQVKAEAPQTVDWLCEECKEHFIKVLEYLDELEITYNLDASLVRGLDYYTKTVFEFIPSVEDEERKRQETLVGGGRYDNLAEQLGGRSTPGVGFSLGMERVIMKLREKDIPIIEQKFQVFLAQLGEQARRQALVFFEKLRKENLPVVENFTKNSLKAQLEIANKLGIKFTLILGQKEVNDETILIRDMEAGIQEVIAQDKLIEILKKKLEK